MPKYKKVGLKIEDFGKGKINHRRKDSGVKRSDKVLRYSADS